MIDVAQEFALHAKHIKNFLYRYTDSVEDAEDTVQETFIRAIKNAETFRGDCKVSTWLVGIAINLARDRHARLRVQHECEISVVDTDHVDTTHTDDPLEILATKQLEEKLINSMRGNQKFSSAYYATVIDGMSYATVAALEGVPVGAIRSRVHRTREILKTVVKKENR